MHALGESHRLLKPAGILVDIHPLPDPPVLAVFRDEKRIFLEEAPSQGADAYRQADRAIADAVRSHLFALEESTVVDFLTHAPSAATLDSHLTTASEFDKAPGDPEVEVRWADLFSRADKAAGAAIEGVDVVLLEKARITSLRPLSGGAFAVARQLAETLDNRQDFRPNRRAGLSWMLAWPAACPRVLVELPAFAGQPSSRPLARPASTGLS